MNQPLSETCTDSSVSLMFLSVSIFKVKRRCPDQNYNPLNTELYVATNGYLSLVSIKTNQSH